MPLCFRRRLKFIHIPKTGGTSILTTLRMDLSGYHDAWSAYPEQTRDFISFTVVRDPLQRFISQFNFGMSDRSYWHTKGTDNEFGDYQTMKSMSLVDILSDLKSPWQDRQLKHCGWWPQSWFVCDPAQRTRVHYLLRQERLQEDLNGMLHDLGYTSVELGEANVSEKRLQAEDLTRSDELMQLLADIYAADYHNFGYPLPVCSGC